MHGCGRSSRQQANEWNRILMELRCMHSSRWIHCRAPAGAGRADARFKLSWISDRPEEPGRLEEREGGGRCTVKYTQEDVRRPASRICTGWLRPHGPRTPTLRPEQVRAGLSACTDAPHPCGHPGVPAAVQWRRGFGIRSNSGRCACNTPCRSWCRRPNRRLARRMEATGSSRDTNATSGERASSRTLQDCPFAQ